MTKVSVIQLVHREPRPPDICCSSPYDEYDGSFTFFRALAPAVWLALVGVALLVMLVTVGYLSAKDPVEEFAKLSEALSGSHDIAAQRASYAYSGVTAAITLALSFTSVVWAVAAFRGKAPAYRRLVVYWVVLLFAFACIILWQLDRAGYQPFASALGGVLLNPRTTLKPPTSNWTPQMMFVLACFVPAVLAGGAGLLLQPLHVLTRDEVATRRQLVILADRLSELDQLLYVGALALVFGTLQLSAALSVPLAEASKIGDLKTMADICKTLSPTPASSPFFSASSLQRGLSQCNALPERFERLEQTESLRQLVRGVTLSFGLAFSALLAAIYVPALIGLRLMIDPRRASVKRSSAAELESESADSIGDVDPVRRVAAIAATLSPLLAGLVANALAAG